MAESEELPTAKTSRASVTDTVRAYSFILVSIRNEEKVSIRNRGLKAASMCCPGVEPQTPAAPKALLG